MKGVSKPQWFIGRAVAGLLLVLCAAGIRAQVPDDATWEETMAFIQKSKRYLSEARGETGSRILVGSNHIYELRSYALDSRYCFYVDEASLRELKAVERYSGAGMKLIFSAKGVLKQKYCDYRSDDVPSKMMNMDAEELENYLSVPYRDYHGARVTSHYSSLEFDLTNSKMGERLIEAFEHLIDLSGEGD